MAQFPFLQQGDEKWLQVRAQCAVTASRYADALGVGYKSRKRLMQEKLGLKPADETNELMQFGIDNEAWVCEVYFRLMRELGYNIRMWSHGFHFDRKDERLGGSIDRIVECVDTGARWVLECKTVSFLLLLHVGVEVALQLSHLIAESSVFAPKRGDLGKKRHRVWATWLDSRFAGASFSV